MGPCGRGDSAFCDLPPKNAHFNSRLLREGRLTASTPTSRAYRNFNSRPHGRGDTSTQRYGSYYSISTRAPTGGATQAQTDGERLGRISTRAPTGGATAHHPGPVAELHYFYSRPHGRGDSRCPARAGWWTGYFNSRPHGRGDAALTGKGKDVERFQLTPPREGRRQPLGHFGLWKTFQLTPPREGRQEQESNLQQRITDFNSRPHGRGRLYPPGLCPRV